MLHSLDLIASTPLMGWSSWNTFGNNIGESVVRETADAFVSSGLQDYGYNYIALSAAPSKRRQQSNFMFGG